MAAAISSQKNEKFIKMTSEPVERLVINLALPSIAIMLISSFYNMADTFFVSFLGTSQVAAVGIAFPFMAIIQATGFFFGQGSGNFMARALGARDSENASRMAVTGFISGFVFMALVAAAGIIFLDPLVVALGATETIKPFAKEYLLYIFLASPWMVSAMVLNQQLRFQGSASIAMVGMLSGAILNIFLDPLFIFVFDLGVRGAAIATVICQMLSFFILFFYGCTRKGNIPVRFKHFSPSPARYVEMFRGGIPAFLRQGLASIAFIIINISAAAYGDAAIAAISIVNRMNMLCHSVFIGFGQGFQPVCGFNYGAKLYSRVKKAFWFCLRVCFVSLFLSAAAMAVFAPEIITLFGKDDMEVIAIGSRGLRLNCISLPLMAIVVMCNMMTQTMGMALAASISSVSRQGVFLIPGILVLSPLLGLLGIQLATPVADFTSLAGVVPILVKVLKGLSVPDGVASKQQIL